MTSFISIVPLASYTIYFGEATKRARLMILAAAFRAERATLGLGTLGGKLIKPKALDSPGYEVQSDATAYPPHFQMAFGWQSLDVPYGLGPSCAPLVNHREKDFCLLVFLECSVNCDAYLILCGVVIHTKGFCSYP